MVNKDFMLINQRDSDNNPHGPWEHYYHNGQLFYRATYKNGIGDGPWEGYYIDGRLGYRGNYKNGKKVGYWYEDGKHKFYVN